MQLGLLTFKLSFIQEKMQKALSLISPGDERRIFLRSFDPLGRKMKHLSSEAEPSDCENRANALKIKWKIKSCGCLILLPYGWL